MAFCNMQNGHCGPAELADEEIIVMVTSQAQILFATDPFCSHCWGLEPVWRKFLYLYRPFFTVRYIYGGLFPSWDGFNRGGISSPELLIAHLAEVAQQYEQPIDTSLWINDGPSSSYPACIATLLVREIEPSYEETYLRRIRQAMFLEARNISRPEVLADCAAEVGLERQRFLDLFQQGHGKIAFQHDLQETQQLGVRGFPTLILKGKDNATIALPGGRTFASLEQAFLRLTGLPRVESQPNPRDVLLAYGSGTTREFSEALGLDRESTIQALTKAGAQRRSLVGDYLWSSV